MNNLRITINHTYDHDVEDTDEELVTTPPTTHRPPIRKEVCPLGTVTSVEYSVRNKIKKLKWFKNIVEAYAWIEKKIPKIYDDIDDWDVRSLEETADRLEERWHNGKNGIIVAKLDQYRFRVYYNPDKDLSEPSRNP
jgi:hypothetical protein